MISTTARLWIYIYGSGVYSTLQKSVELDSQVYTIIEQCAAPAGN